MTVGSLFTGIGGFDLGFERAGFEILFQVEIDDYCQRVLAQHWPDVQRFRDIRSIERLPYVDVLCGGFPCQDISNAGKREGIDGDRSGLWSEFARIIRLVRPRYVVVENVSALLGRGMGRVLGDLSACGFNAEWDCIPACAVGAPHRRHRVWLVAYSSRGRFSRCGPIVADSKIFTIGAGLCADESPEFWRGRSSNGDSARNVPDSAISGLQEPMQAGAQPQTENRIFAGALPQRNNWWAVEPDVGRVAYGIPARVDRLKGLGNALVPQIAEWIARRIVEIEAEK
jgi:DNA (cytosine-5)-methyltransferase 1